MNKFKEGDIVKICRMPYETQKVLGGVLEYLNQPGSGRVVNVANSRVGITVYVKWADRNYSYVEDDLELVYSTEATPLHRFKTGDRVRPGLRWDQDERYRHTYKSHYLHGRILEVAGSTERAIVKVLWECGDAHNYFADELQLETDLVYSKVMSGPDTLSTSPPQGLDKSLFQVQTIYLNQTA